MAPHAITDEEYESLYGPDPNTREHPDESDYPEGGVWSGNKDRLAGGKVMCAYTNAHMVCEWGVISVYSK
ncbi:hypothetical protein BV22DRAFT_1135512 [Leucogyrophana mollusca]|uniref:Uncharacterized protein n=1 Tax=Leucogyrophana mollusca TaxID=85980 RepID=A0ACB8AVD4_9AGAM|nr:hypothetical protein BV22DRAFT_1135512 [Leucogyrophana mollusca]